MVKHNQQKSINAYIRTEGVAFSDFVLCHRVSSPLFVAWSHAWTNYMEPFEIGIREGKIKFLPSMHAEKYTSKYINVDQ